MVRRVRIAIVSIAIALPPALFVGCSLFVDTSGLSGGGTGSPEASTGNEAGINDGGIGDGPTTGDASSTCDGSFCDDFDDSPLGAKWTTTLMDPGTELVLATPVVSPPYALRAHAFSPSASQFGALLTRNLGPGSAVACEFSMYLVTRPTKSIVDVFRISTSGGDVSDYALSFGVDVGVTDGTFRADVGLIDGGCECPRQEANPTSPKMSTWTRVRIQTDFATATVKFDGAIVASGAFGGFTPDSDINVSLGLDAYNIDQLDWLFDDFVCTVTP